MQCKLNINIIKYGNTRHYTAKTNTEELKLSNKKEKFLFGTATAAHQVEGNNINSDCWVMENLKPSTFAEPSGDAVDHYNRYEEDLDLMANNGFNAFRFTIEWARLEPEQGKWDEKEFEHYRKVLEACHKRGITPVVTIHHFSSPKWLISLGGWEEPKTADLFAAYCEKVVTELGDLFDYVCTINEANMGLQLGKLIERMMKNMAAQKAAQSADNQVQVGINENAGTNDYMAAAIESAKAFGCEPGKVNSFLSPRTEAGDNIITDAHKKARAAMKKVKPELKIGITLSLHDNQWLDEEGRKLSDADWEEEFRHYLPAIEGDDFLGVQCYTRKIFDKNGIVALDPDAPRTQNNYEDYPPAIGNVVRTVAKDFKGDILITENGIGIADDERRINYINGALDGVKACIDDGIPVIGYMHWSLLDNFEWQVGYSSTFGLIAVDRTTQTRYPKPSFAHLASKKSMFIKEEKAAKTVAFNPYLPSYEYVPDGEPHVFGDRVYVYGSHDRFGGDGFCLNDYVCWSAPVDDLGNWKYEGVIYRKDQDPLNKDGKMNLYAPDAIQGPDGRYYLYYALHMLTVISVAVADTPVGPFEFYGHIKFPDGKVSGSEKGDINNFDPGIFIDDDGRIFLFSGFAPAGMFKKLLDMRGFLADRGYGYELEPDMLTIKNGPFPTVPGPTNSEGSGFEGHEFFEASSMRKINGKYYFIYSSILSHELCWAVCDKPDGEYKFGGILVSIGDLGLNGNTEAVNYLGNTHGSIEMINGEPYVFYHRQTNASIYCRQGCAEKIVINKNGSIEQAEITSCGLNGAPLKALGTHEARIACNLASKNGVYQYANRATKKSTIKKHPYFTQTGVDRECDPDQYITNIQDGSWAGFKYFDFDGSESSIEVTLCGKFRGKVLVSTERGGKPIASIKVTGSKEKAAFSAGLEKTSGKKALFFTFSGRGVCDFFGFTVK